MAENQNRALRYFPFRHGKCRAVDFVVHKVLFSKLFTVLISNWLHDTFDKHMNVCYYSQTECTTTKRSHKHTRSDREREKIEGMGKSFELFRIFLYVFRLQDVCEELNIQNSHEYRDMRKGYVLIFLHWRRRWKVDVCVCVWVRFNFSNLTE